MSRIEVHTGCPGKFGTKALAPKPLHRKLWLIPRWVALVSTQTPHQEPLPKTFLLILNSEKPKNLVSVETKLIFLDCYFNPLNTP